MNVLLFGQQTTPWKYSNISTSTSNTVRGMLGLIIHYSPCHGFRGSINPVSMEKNSKTSFKSLLPPGGGGRKKRDPENWAVVKVPISPKYFFRLNKSLHLFEMHCAFLLLLNPNIDLLQAVKVRKSGHHLSHDRASKGYGSTPCLTSQTSLHACLQRLNTMQISL